MRSGCDPGGPRPGNSSPDVQNGIVEALLSAFSSVMIFDSGDEECGPDWCLHGTRRPERPGDPGERVCVTRSDPIQLLLAALSREDRKRCRGPCGRELLLVMFSHDANSEDGRLRRCKECERDRQGLYRRGMKQPNVPALKIAAPDAPRRGRKAKRAEQSIPRGWEQLEIWE